jgi:hypothetical protein
MEKGRQTRAADHTTGINVQEFSREESQDKTPLDHRGAVILPS